MGTITTPPRGLISLFGLRDMGAVPNDLSQVVASTVDITEFCLTNRDAVNLGTAGIGAPGLHTPVGGTVDPTVPPGELWYVHQFGISTGILAAGVTQRLRCALVDSTLYFARGPAVTATAGEAALTASDRMFIATPGQSLKIWCESHTGAASNVFAYALITRLRI